MPATLEYEPATARFGRGFRWWICFLVFAATTINYIDRQVIAILKPTLQHDLGWNEIQYSDVVFWFQAAYAAGYLLGGRMMDLIGLRRGYALAVVLWSFAAMGHAWARTVVTFSAARAALGLAEGGNYPAGVKTVSEWFPRRERALATGIFNSGANIGAIITPLTVPYIVVHLGWPAAFLLTGCLGFFWLIAWLLTFHDADKHPRISAAELAYIKSDPPDPVVHLPWVSLLGYRATWAFIVGMCLTSPIWWFYLYWVPGFLFKQHGVDLLHLGPPLVVIYLVSDVGSIAGGWLSSSLIHRGWSVNRARKTSMLICALCVVPVFAAAKVSGTWPATLLIALAAAAHQGWAANLYTLVSDTMPRKAVSSVVGIGGMAGGIAGMVFAKLVGYVLEWTGSYLILFAIGSGAYLTALLIIQLLLPRVEGHPIES